MATYQKRTLNDGTARWDAQIRRRGVIRKKSHRTKAEAKKWALRVEREIDEDSNMARIDPNRLVTPSQLVEAHPWLGGAQASQGEEVRRRRGMRQLRWLLNEAHRNGLAAAIIRPSGRRILIDLDAFDRWLESRREHRGDEGEGCR